MSVDDWRNLEGAVERGCRLIAALEELLEMRLEEARRLKKLEEEEEAEWRLHCEQYGGEDVGCAATYDIFFAMDWE